MLDLLSPLRGYIAQSLQLYLGTYIEDIQLEGLGLFGGDVVLNDLEIKRHVLRESLEIPSSFDFSRGFIRELRIHIPWTQLLSQPIEVKLYTVELILTAKSERRGTSVAADADAEPPLDKIEQPKSGWIHDTLQKILANVSVQLNNLVLKYEHDDVVFSIALGTLDFYSASESDGWKRSFEELRAGRRAICKRIDAKDVTIFLDRYTSEGDTRDGVRRKVVGYEVPVLSRTSASVRAKLMLFPKAAGKGQDGRRNSRPTSPLHQQLPPTNGAPRDEENVIDVDGLFAYEPSVMCDPFYYYSCNRARVAPMYEVDVFIGELLFSVSDRQLEMLNQLITSASRKLEQAYETRPPRPNANVSKAEPIRVPVAPVGAPTGKTEAQSEGIATKQESWFGWAINALGTTEDEEEDELVSELLAETRGALLKIQPPASDAEKEDSLAGNGPVTKTSSVRLCISSASLTLRKHELEEQELEHQDSTIAESEEELVPVANLGMVKVPLHTRTRKVTRPAVPILNLSLSYVALEMLLTRGEEQSGTDIVFEIEKVQLVSATASDNREGSKCKKGQALLTWGGVDSSHFSDCVSHPYFINSFFGEEATRLNQRETRSFEIVQVGLDADIPVWKTLEVGRGDTDSNASICECSTLWNGATVRCIPIATITEISQQAIGAIGIKERVLDGGILSNAVSTAWASSGFPISISGGLARALSSATDDYRAHRNPDVGAADNLEQLIQPQLIALFSRYALHSCSAASPHVSSVSSVRHRSVHSALRLRFASTTDFIDREDASSDGNLRHETISKVLDISIGAAQAVLEPPKLVEIAEALSIILRRNEVPECDSEERTAEVSLENAVPRFQSIVQSDIKLITLSNGHIRVPDLCRKAGEDEIIRGGLSVIARDFVWLSSFHLGSSESRIQLGVGSVNLGEGQAGFTPSTPIPLVEVLGFELLVTENSADGGDDDVLLANLDKLRLGVNSSATDQVVKVVNGLSRPLGYPIPWDLMEVGSNRSDVSFLVEVCGASFSKTVSNRPRLIMAQRQALHAEIASVSASLMTTNSDSKAGRSIFQGGIAPAAIRGLSTSAPLFKFDIVQEKSSGVLRAVPLLGSIGLLSLNPGQLVGLKGVSLLATVILRLVKRISANLLTGKESLSSRKNGVDTVKLVDSADNMLPTGWNFIINLKADGGGVFVNEALLLCVPLVSISSVEIETANQVKSGGHLKLVCTMENATLGASEDGILRGLADPVIFAVRDVRFSMDFSHNFVDNQHAYAFDLSFHVSSVEALLSRLKLRYLLKFPFSQAEVHPRSLKSQQNDSQTTETVAHNRWHWRLGAQLDSIQLTCTSEINHRSNCEDRLIQAVVSAKVFGISVATRMGNHHPTKHHLQPTTQGRFTDTQASVNDIQVVERLQNARETVRGGYGEFSRLPDHAFLGVLVCLELADLKRLSETFHVSNTNVPEQSLPSAMHSWHLTSSIAKSFQEASVEWRQHKTDGNQSVAEIPLIVSCNDADVARNAHSFPLLSAFYRNYNEAGLPHHVIAGSMESTDVALTTSSLHCFAAILDVYGSMNTPKPSFNGRSTKRGDDADKPAAEAQTLPDVASQVSMTGIEVSLLLGHLRLIFPDEHLMDAILSRQAVVPGNVCVVLKSLSLASAVRNEISLDGLGYPPFNSRVLPRRPIFQAQRFGQSELRVSCKAGNVSGFVAELEFNGLATSSNREATTTGPFEKHMGRTTGYSAYFSNAKTFWSPLNVTCNVEEELSAIEDLGTKTSAAVALTKLRLDLHKPSFDVLVTRFAGVIQGIGAVRQSAVTPSRVTLKPVRLSKPNESEVVQNLHQREVSFSCDGIELNMFEMHTSTHFRVGTIAVAHSVSALSGSASIQNVVIGHRPSADPKSSTQMTSSREEVVFGANAEPSLWQLAVENYPEKLVSARWHFGNRTEGTLFLDIQAHQLHVSHHLILAVTRFIRLEPSFAFSPGYWEKKTSGSTVQTIERRPFAFQQRWNIKVLVAPSVMSYWRQNTLHKGGSGIWMTSGQLFASVRLGTDEMVQQSLRANEQVVNEISRFVSVPTLEMMLNVDKFGVNTSDDLPPLEVHWHRNPVGPVPMDTSSTWKRFSKYISLVSEAQRLVHDCSIRITGEQCQMLERIAVGEIEVCLTYTDMSRTSIQAEVNSLSVKLSSFSLGAILSLLTPRAGTEKKGSCDDVASDTSENAMQETLVSESLDGVSVDDFKSLRRMAEARRPSPGELVFTEALLIETQSAASASSPVASAKVQIRIDANNSDIELEDVAAYLEECNEPWGIEERVERSSRPGVGNKTDSWMGMRWCYHIPRRICMIVADPVPIPPTGIPNGWPSWGWDQDQEGEARRLCDIVCQLRCWDSKKACFVLVCEFYVPWERTPTNAGSENLEDAYEPGSFGELVSQWFDDDMEETRYRAKLLEFSARTRTLTFDNSVASENWELRWRTPLQSEQESENKQKRLVVNALLASSLQVHSILDCGAYQRVLASITLPQATLSVSHVGSANDPHDIITAELNSTIISCAVSGSNRSRTLNMQVSSAVHVYLDNMAQLLTVSVIPRTTVDAMLEFSSKGIEVSTLIGPVSVYLNQTSMLVMSSIPRLLQPNPKPSQSPTAIADENLSSMRMKIINNAGVDIWYRQEGTSECLLLAADASTAYSWLSLANSPFYQLRFAIEDPHQTLVRHPIKEKGQDGKELPANEDSRWCDPCNIKGNAVTGRFFGGHGFLWICVELSGLQTIVTLRSSLTVRNYCDFPVRFKLNEDAHEYGCARSDELYPDARTIQRGARHHPNCISLDGSACTLSTLKHADENVACVMAESVSRFNFGVKDGSWCSLTTQGSIPSEFDLAKVNDSQSAGGSKTTQCSFAVLPSEDSDESSHYAWAQVCRVQCKTVLPTDFDPLQPQVSRRYTWMEVSFWPAITLENTMDIPVTLSLSQKATSVEVKMAPSSEKCLSAVNPFEPVDVQLQYQQPQASARANQKPLSFLLKCSTPVEDQIFDFEGCRVIASFCNNHRPMIRLKTERILSVANMTPDILNVSIGSPLGNHSALQRFDSCVERSVGFSVVSNRLVISIATIVDPSSQLRSVEWSPEVSINVKGDAKPIVIPPARAGLRSSASAYSLELLNTDGFLKLIIRPQVVVINSTVCDLKFIATDGRGNMLVDEDETSLISGNNAGWCVPVCLHKEAKKRSITADVSSWLSSKLSRRPSEDLSSASNPALVTRLSCSFLVSLVEDGYEWTEEIAVLLPKIPLHLNADGKLKSVEVPESSSAPSSMQNGLYPAPSTTTHRRRLLVHHRGFRHKMLTYTLTQEHNSIQIMFFVDHQPPVIIHNQWQNMLGFRNMSFPADPEGIAADFYLEYDWGLQVTTKQRGSMQRLAEEDSDTENNEPKSENHILSDWLDASAQSSESTGMFDTTSNERTRFQIGSPQYGWSNALWQVGGIQFASFTDQDANETGKTGPTFLVMCFYRAGSWLISITCLEEPRRDGQPNAVPTMVLPAVASSTKMEQASPTFLKVGVIVEELSLHFCDEHDPVWDPRGMIVYPEILRATCNAVSIVFATAPDPPEASCHSTRLGYLSHIRSYTTLFAAIDDIEVGHFLQTCNFPVILCFPETHASKYLLKFDQVKKHEKLRGMMGKLIDKKLPEADNASLVARVIYTDTWDPIGIPSYFHSIELKLSPAVLQVEDDILLYANAFIRPILDALEGEVASAAVRNGGENTFAASHGNTWCVLAYESAVVTTQRKVYIEHLEISNVQVTITARVSIPVLNSFDGTPLHFGSTEMREVFSFPDQLYKDLAADYVADTIVRSPLLLMSLNIIGNPAGFVRSFGQGVRDLVEIPLAASRNGYSPWILTKGVVGGVASFLGHATAATLTSVSGFSYSISRTMDQLTLSSDQLKKRHYTRPTHLSSALADGLGSLGSSVVGAATGVITTPISVYKERQMQGLDTGIRNVVGGVGMGLVGIVARPMGGVASLVSLASDGLLYGMGGTRMPFDDSVSRFDARPNELLRYKLKVLPDAIGSSLIFAHGVWVVPNENKLLVAGHDLDFISKEQLELSENDPTRSLLLPADSDFRIVQVTVVCSNECLYVVGVSGAQNQNVLVRTSLESIQAVEESLKEPTVFDLGIKTPLSAEWLRFRLPARQRRHLSHQLRLWLAEETIL